MLLINLTEVILILRMKMLKIMKLNTWVYTFKSDVWIMITFCDKRLQDLHERYKEMYN